jgi:WD40 repeat protein
MAPAINCPSCGSPLSTEAPEGLCPKCLLQAGLEKTSDHAARSAPTFGPRIPDDTPGGVAPAAESTITRPPFRVRYFGDYELRAEIAQGGMGVVYRGRQVSLDRPVALKMILPDKLDDEAVKRFRQEAESAGGLDHPNIVPVYEVGQHDGQHFLSMRLIEGSNLKEDVPRFRKDSRAAARLLATVARAVHHAHQRGVLHRDLKPQNILVDRDGQPHVTDFGLAKRVAAGRDVTQSGAWAGTPEYMAPEQAAGEFKGLTTAADIYSLGAILYTLLTGNPPFRGAYPAILRRISEDEPARPRAIDRRIDPDLETICLKCLEKAPSRRYATAGALADDLDHWLGGEPIAARPVSSWERGRKWVRRKPAIAALSAAVLLLALAGLSGVLWQWRAAVENERRARASEQKEATARVEAEHQRNKAGAALKEARKASEAALKASEALKEANRLAIQREQEALAARDEATRQRNEVDRVNAGLKETLRQVRQNAYFAHLAVAQREWEAMDVVRARALLENPDEAEFRGFEWHYLKRLYNTERITVNWHNSDRVTGVAFSPDGSQVISASTSNLAFAAGGERIPSSGAATVRFLDAASGRELRRLDGAAAAIPERQGSPAGNLRVARYASTEAGGLAISPDGRRLAAGSSDATIKVWEAESGRELFALKGHTRDVTCVAFSPDGERLASGSVDENVKLWDMSSGRELLTLSSHTRRIAAVAFSPDGKQLASSGGAAIKIWDPGTGQELLSFQRSFSSSLGGLAYSPDGKSLACAVADDTVEIRDATSGEKLIRLNGHAGGITALAFTPDGKWIAAGSLNTSIKLWRADTGEELHTFLGNTSPVMSVAFSPDGQRLASASGNTVKLWDVAYDQEPLTLVDPGKANERVGLRRGDARGLSFSPDGKRLACGYRNGAVRVWDAATGRELLKLTGHTRDVWGVAFSPDGQRLASASIDQTVKLWNAATGQELSTFRRLAGAATAVAFSPDGRRLVATDLYQTVKVWDAPSATELFSLDDTMATRGYETSVRGVAFSPDGNRLAVASRQSGSLRLWDTSTGRELLLIKGPVVFISSVAFSPDGQRLAAAYSDATVRFWEAASGRLLLSLKESGQVTSMVFSPDGQRLATASMVGAVKLWDAGTGQDLLTVKPNPSPVLGLTFSPDGKRLAGIGADCTVRIWGGDRR